MYQTVSCRRILWGLTLVLSLLPTTAFATTSSSSDAFREFSLDLLDTFNNRDATLFEARFHASGFADNVLQAMGPSAEDRARLHAEIVQEAARFTSAVAGVLDQVERWTFLGLRELPGDDPARVGSLFRLDMGGEGIGYWEFHLVRQAEGIGIEDWMNYATGLRPSHAMGRMMALLNADSPGLWRARDADGVGAAGKRRLRRFLASCGQKRYDAAATHYRELPAALQAEPVVLICKLEAAKLAGGQAYRDALAELAHYRGDDPRFALALVDHYLHEQDYARVHAAIDQVAGQIGPDAGLELLHGNVSVLNGEHGRAVGHYAAALRLDEDYEEVYWGLLEAFVAERRYVDAVLTLRVLEEHFSYIFDPRKLAEVAGYGEFAGSAEFHAWAEGAGR